MSSPPQPRSDFTFPWSIDHEPQDRLFEKLEQFYRLCHLRWQFIETCRLAARPALERAGVVLDQTVLATALIVLPKAFASWDALRPALLSHTRALLPFIPLASAEEEALNADPIWNLLAEFRALAPEQQDKSAKNLALLWDHFETTFDGLSGFLAEPQAEQSLYLEKLMTASRRMKLARGSEVAFHYVTVELMRLYVHGLQRGRSDRAALTLASNVVALINRGRMMTPAITADAPSRPLHAAAA
ncbi:hypothetical protein [Microvirga sp. VF16]|uniref:hypothetical protein n=1 Tax=Microvirga sp. VF16 TaxID=2807101 RepID=UPI00193DCCA5|nr:hypothetical protein [Microvirga sp. VF16]QRM29808.1 hypothetical protein JO965_01945 [Microvirga sp. VF16]